MQLQDILKLYTAETANVQSRLLLTTRLEMEPM